MRTATVIYDTSYLMNGGMIERPGRLFSNSVRTLDIASVRLILYPVWPPAVHGATQEDLDAALSSISVQHIIPTEVKQEIVRHLASDEKAPAARTARARCAEIMADKGYKEISLADIPITPNREALLGPDSKTDKGIIALARRLATTSEPELVYIASNDGGIHTELSLLHSQDGLPIFSIASHSQYESAYNDLFVSMLEQARKARTASH